MITTGMPNLFTDDMDRALAFYTDQVGFAVCERFPADGPAEHVVLRLGSTLLALSGPRAVTAAGLPPTRGQPLELVLWCDDVDAETARLQAEGVSVLVAPYQHIGGHRRAYLTDPIGNWLALVDAPRPDPA